MAYLLDANIFIEADKRYYGLDFCPAFWDWLIDRNAAGAVFSIKHIQEDILKGTDKLAEWVAARGPEFFLEVDAVVAPALSEVSIWASNNHYNRAAKADFLAKSDYYLVAYARCHNHIVVTHEKPENTPRRVKIPNACDGVGVTWASPFDMLRAEGARFILG